MSDTNGFKFQWSGNSADRLQMFVIRTDDKEEFDKLVKEYQYKLPKDKAFPDDSGPTATAPENVVSEPAPICGTHGVFMAWKPPGVSKAGRKYPGFWSCPTRNADGSFCTYRPNGGKA